MSSSRALAPASRLPRLVRCMHTPGRQVPHPPQGGANSIGPAGSTSPTPHGHDLHNPSANTALPPAVPAERNISSDPAGAIPPTIPVSAESSEPQSSNTVPGISSSFGRGRRARPARKIPVQLPSGYPEPPRYPPPQEYFDSLSLTENRQPLHPLWKFFHVENSAKLLSGADDYSSSDAPMYVGAVEAMTRRSQIDGTRSWSAAELRLKSFADLHTLWYVLLRERNVLSTQEEERKRLGINSNLEPKWMTSRKQKCRQSMARIKQVLNERRLALIATYAQNASHIRPENGSPALFKDGDVRYDKEDRMFLKEAQEKGLTGDEAEEYALEAKIAATEAGGAKEETVKHVKAPEERLMITDGEVPKAEIEARDEGFGGGEEAKKFDKETEVDQDGKVKLVE